VLYCSAVIVIKLRIIRVNLKHKPDYLLHAKTMGSMTLCSAAFMGNSNDKARATEKLVTNIHNSVTLINMIWLTFTLSKPGLK
jgi:hypothetical protein